MQDREMFASGQKSFAKGGQGRKAMLLIWRADTLSVVCRLSGVHDFAVTSVAFSPDGKHVLSSGLDAMHSIALWDVASGTLLMTQTSSPRPILGLAFLRYGPRLSETSESTSSSCARSSERTTDGHGTHGERIVICGERELRFGKLNRGVRWRKAVFGARAELQTLPCVAVNTDGRVLTGTRRGDLYVWAADRCRLWQLFHAHDGPLQCVSVCAQQVDGASFATGGADGFVVLWGVVYEHLRRIDLNRLCKRAPLDAVGRPQLQPPARGIHVRAVCWDAVQARVLVGTQSNELVRVQLLPDGTEMAVLLTQGHQGGCVRTALQGTDSAHRLTALPHDIPDLRWCTISAVAEHPRSPRFASAGEDGAVKLWCIAPHKLYATRRLQSIPQCLSFSPDGAKLAIGCSDGRLVVLSAENLDLHLERISMHPSIGLSTSAVDQDRNSDARATTVAYSPDGRHLAMGDMSGAIRLFLVPSMDGTIERSYRFTSRCLGHKGRITHLGWSDDSSCVRSNCDLPELRFWDQSGMELDASDDGVRRRLSYKQWASSDGGLLYCPETRGVHLSPDGQAVDLKVRAIGIAHGTGQNLFAIGDEFQQIRLLRYPCIAPPPTSSPRADLPACHTGHASTISAIRFSFNNRYLISAGGEDLTLFVWRVRSAQSAQTAPTILSSDTGSTLNDAAMVTIESQPLNDEMGEEDEDEDSDVEDGQAAHSTLKSKGAAGNADAEHPDEEDDDTYLAVDPVLGDQVGSIQPWRAAIVAPSNARPLEEVTNRNRPQLFEFYIAYALTPERCPLHLRSTTHLLRTICSWNGFMAFVDSTQGVPHFGQATRNLRRC